MFVKCFFKTLILSEDSLSRFRFALSQFFDPVGNGHIFMQFTADGGELEKICWQYVLWCNLASKWNQANERATHGASRRINKTSFPERKKFLSNVLHLAHLRRRICQIQKGEIWSKMYIVAATAAKVRFFVYISNIPCPFGMKIFFFILGLKNK